MTLYDSLLPFLVSVSRSLRPLYHHSQLYSLQWIVLAHLALPVFLGPLHSFHSGVVSSELTSTGGHLGHFMPSKYPSSMSSLCQVTLASLYVILHHLQLNSPNSLSSYLYGLTRSRFCGLTSQPPKTKTKSSFLNFKGTH